MPEDKKIPLRFRNPLTWLTSRMYILLYMIVGQLPLKQAYSFGTFFGLLSFWMTRKRRKIVEENIRILKAWGSRRGFKNAHLVQEDRSIAKAVYQSNMGNLFYSCSMINKSFATIRNHLKVKNIDSLKQAYEEKKGVIILFSHTGPWELTVLLPKLIPFLSDSKDTKKLGIMYRPLNNYYFNQWYYKKRVRFEAEPLSRDLGFFKIMRHVKKGGIVCVANDIRMREGIKVELFDKQASSSKIPYALHKASGAPVFAITLVKNDSIDWEFQLKEIKPPTCDEFSENSLLKAFNEHLEQMIFNNPHDYFFFQNRFK